MIIIWCNKPIAFQYFHEKINDIGPDHRSYNIKKLVPSIFTLYDNYIYIINIYSANLLLFIFIFNPRELAMLLLIKKCACCHVTNRQLFYITDRASISPTNCDVPLDCKHEPIGIGPIYLFLFVWTKLLSCIFILFTLCQSFRTLPAIYIYRIGWH